MVIFVSAQVIITSITALGMFTNLCLVLPLLLASSLVPKFHFQLKKKQPDGGPESALTLYKWLAGGVTALAQLRVCALMWKICFFRRNNTYLLISGWFNRFIPKVRHFRNLSVWELSQKSNELVSKYAKQNVRVEKINQFGYNLTEILHMKILISTWAAMSK